MVRGGAITATVAARPWVRRLGPGPAPDVGLGAQLAERSVAALTASRTAARTPCGLQGRSPAAVVPPGEVTAARSASGASSPIGEEAGRPRRIVRARGRAATSRGQTGEHAGLDQRLGDEEHVRRTRAGEAGDGVELRSRGPARRRRRRRAPARPSSRWASVACVPAGDGGGARPHERRACWASPAPPAGPGSAASRVAIGDPGGDREDEACVAERRAGRPRARRATSSGFTATTTTSASGTAQAGLGTTRTPGKRGSSSRRRSGSTSATASASALPAGVEQAGDERLAHPAATEECERSTPPKAYRRDVRRARELRTGVVPARTERARCTRALARCTRRRESADTERPTPRASRAHPEAPTDRHLGRP